MSDRTYGECVIVACPDEHIDQLIELLEGYDIPPTKDDGGVFDLIGHTLYNNEVSLGWAGDLALELKEVPGISFVVREDPAYEYMGDKYMFTPELGLFWGACDAKGTVHVNAHALTVLFQGDKTMKDIRGSIELLTGALWDEALTTKTNGT